MHSSTGWYSVAYWQKAVASTLTILSLVVMTGGPLFVPTVANATEVQACSAVSHEVVSDTTTTNTGDDPSGNSVVVTPTAVTTSAWTATIAGASWIWSTAAIVDGTVDNTETFTRTFTIDGVPTGSATLAIAADNYYTVSVNGTPIGSEMADENNFSTADSYPVTNLVNGVNTITVVAKNKGIPGDAINNPAGVLFKLSYTSNDCLIKVHIYKYLQDGETTAQVPDNSTAPAFPMNATWQTANLNGGASASGDYVLGNNHGGTALKYAADTSPMTVPADYTTHEVTGGASPVVGPNDACTPGKYQLLGYKTGDSLSAAEGAAITATVPAFTGLSADKYVIVVNKKCADTVVVQNSCPLPDALTDVTVEAIGASPSGEETLQQILNDESYGVNVTTDQKQFQVWNVTAGSSVLIDPIKFVDKFAGHNQVFGYYTNGDTLNFVPVFKTGSITGQESVPLYTAGPFAVTVPVGATTIGFAIKSFSGNSLTGTFATENALNTASEDHVLVYNPSANKYALAFEDLPLSGDHDYNDLVVEVTLHCQAVCEAGVNLLANPGFEATPVAAASWNIFPSGTPLLGWLVAWLPSVVPFNTVNPPAVANAEIQSTGLIGVTASEGSQWTELDADWDGPSGSLSGEPASVSLSQTVPTVIGQTYNVSFDTKDRDGADNAVEAVKDGVAQPTVTGATNGNGWTTHTYSFVATGATTQIAFRDAGATSNSLGSLLDNTNVSCVPPPPNTATISAKKVLCDAEQYLPNWGAGAADITGSTAQSWVDQSNGHCHLVDWKFQWSADGVGNPGDNVEVGGTGWNEFTSSASVPAGARVWVREEIPTGYVPFTGQNTNQNVSAELYCSTDVLNYDNWDFIDPVVAGTTYHCVGFNAPVATHDGDDEDKATLTIVKHTIGGDGKFYFDVTNEDTTSLTTEDGWKSTDISLDEGTYNVTEQTASGWTYNGVSCVYDNESVGDVIPQGESITVDAGDHVTCTFTNTKNVVVIDDDGDDNGNGGGGNPIVCDTGTHLVGDQCVPNGGGGPIQSFSIGGGGGGPLGGQVLGASCGLYMDKHLKFGSGKNDKEQVKKLQQLLNKYGFGPIPVTGFFGPATLAAVKAFQAKYGDDVLKPWGINTPTGLVYLSTLIKINLLECPDLSLQLPPLVPWSANPNAQ